MSTKTMQWQAQLRKAAELDDKELARHASVSYDNRHRCEGDCFTCAAATVLEARQRALGAGPVQPGITMTLTVEEWRDIRDALIEYPHARNRGDIAELVTLLSSKIGKATGNPMD